MCSETVEYDCSNLFKGDCVVYACYGTCSDGGDGGDDGDGDGGENSVGK
jgi:hypothetical protein